MRPTKPGACSPASALGYSPRHGELSRLRPGQPGGVPVLRFLCLAARPQRGREVRKTVTVLFSDVTGSTSLGELLDPESLRNVMSRYFDLARTVVQRHGGTVEKFIGDAVMAVFGVPAAHEDDALRAVRAATEMRENLAALNDELERGSGVRFETRTGVNSGEVVAGDPSSGQSFVSGDAVNVAARLEQAAQPGEVLIGAGTLSLVRDAVRVEELKPLPLKGKGGSGRGVPLARCAGGRSASRPPAGLADRGAR